MSPPNPFDAAARALRDAAGLSKRPVSWTEQQLMRQLRSRLDNAEGEKAPAGSDVDDRRLANRMEGLLDRALEQTAAASSEDLYLTILNELVADEARILSALSDGSATSLMHVFERTRTGASGQLVIENASLVGRTANLSLPQYTPAYVTHLLTLGLVEIGPEDSALKSDYEILSADDAVRDAIKRASRGPVPPRVVRHTLRLSRLGREFWAACERAGDDADGRP